MTTLVQWYRIFLSALCIMAQAMTKCGNEGERVLFWTRNVVGERASPQSVRIPGGITTVTG